MCESNLRFETIWWIGMKKEAESSHRVYGLGKGMWQDKHIICVKILASLKVKGGERDLFRIDDGVS